MAEQPLPGVVQPGHFFVCGPPFPGPYPDGNGPSSACQDHLYGLQPLVPPNGFPFVVLVWRTGGLSARAGRGAGGVASYESAILNNQNVVETSVDFITKRVLLSATLNWVIKWRFASGM